MVRKDAEPNRSVGAKHTLFNACMGILSAGDEAIIPAPYWVSYPDMVRVAEGTPVVINTGIEDGFKVTPEKLEAVKVASSLGLQGPSAPIGAQLLATGGSEDAPTAPVYHANLVAGSNTSVVTAALQQPILASLNSAALASMQAHNPIWVSPADCISVLVEAVPVAQRQGRPIWRAN